MSRLKSLLYVEKYRPKTVAECILPERIKFIFQQMVDNKEIPNLILSGLSGSGKTTVAKAMLDEMDFEYILINASAERNIDTVRTTTVDFCSTRSMDGKRKAIIFDEFDGFNQLAMAAMRGVIEEFKHVRFIFTCNFENKIMDAIKSRTTIITFNILKDEEDALKLALAKRIAVMLKDEGKKFSLKDIAYVVNKDFPDNRRVINEIQCYSAGDSLDITNIFKEIENFDALITMLKDKEFSQMRQWVEDNSDIDFYTLVKRLYEEMNVTKLAPESVPDLVLTLNDYETKACNAINIDIHTVAMLTTLMLQLTFK